MYRIVRHSVCGILVGVFALTVLGGAVGAETLKCRQGMQIIKVQSAPVGNVPGQVVGVGEAGGVAFCDKGDVAVTGTSFTFFYTDGSGPAESFAPFTFEDGSSFVIKFTVTAKADTKTKSTSFKGKFSFVQGSGRFAGIEGHGSVTGRRFAPLGAGAALYFDYTGSYTLP